jgi:hypothetical protein
MSWVVFMTRLSQVGALVTSRNLINGRREGLKTGRCQIVLNASIRRLFIRPDQEVETE